MPILKSIDPKTAKEWLDNNKAVIVDVREPGEHLSARIKGSILVPVGKINTSMLPDITNKKLIIHCQLGRRGSIACEKLLKSNANLDIYNLDGGIVAWEKAGFEVQKSPEMSMSIDRQVQITIGIGVLSGMVLGYLIAPSFYLLSGIFGLGILYAGISDSCALAYLLTKMPWNKND